MSSIKIWHNSRCSKSREAKTILDDKGENYETFEYLKNEFSTDDLRQIIKMLGISDIREMLRVKEDEYKELNISSSSLSQDEILELVVKHPKLVERPIVIKDAKAVIGRPMENVIELLKS
ncbi:MAG: arsenate reductase (glutaredoxin) [Campylobacterota bacterium]|nr:arsenate reductase (glutaredoxin) [Campylobacterota bacterium]